MSVSKDLEIKQLFTHSMRSFLSDRLIQDEIASLADELLNGASVRMSATYKGLYPRQNGFNPDEDLDIYMDGDFAFGLHLDNGEVPAVMYAFNHDQQVLDILQIQAIQSYPKMPFKGRWEKLGIHLIEMLGEWRGDISTTMIRPVSENNWYFKWSKESREYEAGRLRYDIGAQRAGYSFEPSLKRFVQHLPFFP